MDIEKINRLNNEYRALVREARAIREEKGDPSREEGLCYQNASERAGQLASMTVGAEMQHWISEQDMCSGKMREIWYYLNPEEAKKKAQRTAPAAKPAEVKSNVYVQFAGKDFSESSLTEAVKEAYTALGNRAEDIRTIDIYVKPEESVAYYTVNGQGSDEFKIQL